MNGAVGEYLRRTLDRAVDFAFPAECPLCRQAGGGFRCQDGTNTVYCTSCRDKLSPAIPFACPHCGAAVGSYSDTTSSCVHCRGRSLAFESVHCLGMYDGLLKQAMLSAKWSYSPGNIKSLGLLLWNRKSDELQSLGIDRIIPVPQHWRQRLLRHFNPAWIIAETLSKKLSSGGLSIPCDAHILRRGRHTRPQKRVAVNQRFANQQGAFRVRDGHLIRGRRLLIVDDVLTTGATCSEAARVLHKAGAAECHVAVISRVLDHSA